MRRLTQKDYERFKGELYSTYDYQASWGFDGIITIALFDAQEKRIHTFKQDDNSQDYLSKCIENFNFDTTLVPDETLQAFKKAYPNSGVEEIERAKESYEYLTRDYQQMLAVYLYYYPDCPQLKDLVKVNLSLFNDLASDSDCNIYTYSNWNFRDFLNDNIKHGTTFQEVVGFPEDLLDVFNVWYARRVEIVRKLYVQGVRDKGTYEAYSTLQLGDRNKFYFICEYLANNGCNTPELKLVEITRRAELFQAIPGCHTMIYLEKLIRLSEKLGVEANLETNAIKRDIDLLERKLNENNRQKRS